MIPSFGPWTWLLPVGVLFGAGVVCGVLGHIGWQHLHTHLSLGWR